MKNAKVFLVGDIEGSLTSMTEMAFDKEDILQVLLENYPDLLPGEQINPDNPCHWLLVARELGVRGAEDGANQWSLDHLFLDQDGIPTFIECKRASDTRIRREVVAQMLDYAANGTEYWTIDELIQAAAETARRHGRSLESEILTLIGAGDKDEIDAYWSRVEANLREGKVRLLFVSDHIPKELRRLVEFLNEQMEKTEVLAVEIKQFVGDKHKAIVPRVIGATETARSTKASTEKRSKITENEFLDKCIPEAIPFFKYILEETRKRNQSFSWGTSGFSVGSVFSDGRRYPFVICQPPDRLEIWLTYFERAGVPSEKITELIRSLTSQFTILRETNKQTLITNITSQNHLQVQKAYDFCLSIVNQIQESLGAENS